MRITTYACAALSCFAYAQGREEQQAALVESAESHAVVEPLNVAIIGAGAGGASAAYHLAQLAAAADLPINITIFERNSIAGGRSTTVDAYNDPKYPIELGASIFVKVNAILNDAVDKFNLSTERFIADVDIPGPGLGVWDGQQFVLKMDDGWWDMAKLLWKYGLAPIKTMRLMRKVVGQFLKMYDAPIFPFEDLTQTAQELDLLDVTATTGEQYLLDNGITGGFGRDVVQASTRVNYASNLRYIHGLEAMVCMAAEGGMSVNGGNWQIFDNMVKASNATALFQSEVSNIEKQKDGSYALTFAFAGAETYSELKQQLFDSVILAAPYQFSNLDLPEQIKDVPDEIPYVKLHTTLFTSPRRISPAFFNLSADTPVPRSVLTTLPKDEDPRKGAEGVGTPGFFSISLLRPLTNPKTGRQEYAYKIFSAEPPTTELLARLLGLEDPVGEEQISWMYRKIWNSYPYEYPRVTFEKIMLDENLWYTSGIESFISTMETSALMGKNVARLVVDRWKEELGRKEYGGLLERDTIGEGGKV